MNRKCLNKRILLKAQLKLPMELVDIKIQLDNLRIAISEAFDRRRSVAEIKTLHQAIKKKEIEILSISLSQIKPVKKQ